MNLSVKVIFWWLFFSGCWSNVIAQNNSWLLGEWKGVGVIPGSAYGTVFVHILKINRTTNNQFAGILIQQLMDEKSIRIEKEISGTVLNDQLNIKAGRTLYKKQPLHGAWEDCSACKITNTRVSISSDSLMLTSETRLCGNYCDGYTTYYKALSGFDTLTQRQLVRMFGSPLLVKIFTPVPPLVEVPDNDAAIMDKKIVITDSVQSQLSRTNKVIATYHVSSPEIKLALFDNGEIDGDTVTVYHNKEKIIDRQLLGVQPILFTVKASATDKVHEFILVANNLGRIPPNTALMRITAGSKVYELFASTNLSQNASVVIVYSGD